MKKNIPAELLSVYQLAEQLSFPMLDRESFDSELRKVVSRLRSDFPEVRRIAHILATSYTARDFPLYNLEQAHRALDTVFGSFDQPVIGGPYIEPGFGSHPDTQDDTLDINPDAFSLN